ncbi:MAG: DUF5106 domain-containing protein [Bacteroidetes bacterium]|jgi:hypothetical protein|nr:DUF5106 domain-containing protein [Bacteroidota bacterium]MBT3747945.1 DUF5106 domain-containing protein [Bacteroidota bacterium]MBT4399596.1 DUF5106 domain-containing protein [Bacteroidota bacterium]MBT4408740.1 DUF5106 domain-containing protein [Bacteroidota bacterium]MBT7462778.1 DUF5106 domain-containing protein [Bacteroidota bacterium]
MSINYRVISAIIILLSLALVSCVSKEKKEQGNESAVLSGDKFTIPDIPLLLNTQEQQAMFLVEHYWDNFNFEDSSALKSHENVERIFVDYLFILDQVNAEKSSKGISSLISKASVNSSISSYFFEMAEKYLYNPNSPVRNEFLYEEFLKGALTSKQIDPVIKIRYQYQFDTAQKNKPGNIATDFYYTLKDGTVSSLYKIQAKKLILYFHNPDCPECKISRGKMVDSQIIQQLTGNNELKILAIYPDKELELWHSHYDEFPVSWINSYDKETVIMDEEIYDLKAIPTLYLLDYDKTVIFRDPTIEQIENYLMSLYN